MKVRIFQAFGKDDIERLERELNLWLQSEPRIQIHHTDSAATSVAEDVGSGEMYQALVVSVWYEISN